MSSTIIPPLSDLDLDEFLRDISEGAQRAWVRAFGVELLREELPLCWAAWESDEARQLMGAKAVYIRCWLSIRFEARKKERLNALGAATVNRKGGALGPVSEEEAERTRAVIRENEAVERADPEKVKRMIARIVRPTE